MTRVQVMERFCKLSGLVAEEWLGWSHPADCFCGHNPMSELGNFQFSGQVIKFIEEAVIQRLASEGIEVRWDHDPV